MDQVEKERYRALNTPYPERAKPKFTIVLNALAMGIPIEIDGLKIEMAGDRFEDTDPCTFGQMITIEKTE